MGSRLSWLGIVLVLGAAPLAAQAPVVRTLANPEEYGESFDTVTTLRELPNGKLLLIDFGPKSLYHVDFASGQHTLIGRNGQGPGEYQFPAGLVSYIGDTTLLVDMMGRRMIPVAADGRMGKVVPFPEAVGGLGDPRGADAKGRIYLQTSGFRAGPGIDVTQFPDSTAILRWDRKTDKVDTVARVKLPNTRIQTSGGANARMVMMRSQPYSGQDDWAVSRDGRVGIVRIGDYHLDWVGDGATKGTPVKYEPVKVGAAEKKVFMDRGKDTRGRAVFTVGGAGRGPEMKPPEPKEEDFEWPAVKPPFVPRTAIVSPEGQLWVQRSGAASDLAPVYDVFDATGNLTARISFPKGRRLVGLGNGTAYATRTDDDGLQWLERYKR